MGKDHKDIESNRTKIVATIGPASQSTQTLTEMVRAGLDVARVNFSHGTYDSNITIIEHIREAAKVAGRHVAILQDLQGPKIRVGSLPPEGLELLEEKIVTLHAGVESADHGVIPVPYDRLASDLSPGDRILLEDGTKELEVVEIKGPRIRAKVLLGGRLISHKGLNVPTTSLSVDAMTEKDDQDLAFGLKQDIDFVALSFVSTAAQVVALRKKIEQYLPADMEPPAVIVKIEKHEALEQFDAILAEADGVMIGRGDLGLETPASMVPVHQKELIAKCLVAGKPVITATEMLASMEQRPRPTRAEVSDVANAVIDHSDAVMLSGETAMGKYPVRSVAMMAEIVEKVEESSLDNLMPHREATGEPVPLAMAAAAVELARHIDASAIIVTTRSGYSARAVARFRPEIPIFAATDRVRTRQTLLLSWGVRPIDIGGYEEPEKMVQEALRQLKETHQLAAGKRVVVVSGLSREAGGYDSVVRVVEV